MMKFFSFHFFVILLANISFSFSAIYCCEPEEWERHWLDGLDRCNAGHFEEGIWSFSKALFLLEQEWDYSHPNIYVDRARVYFLLEDWNHSLEDVHTALQSPFLGGTDRARALITRAFAHFQLQHFEDGWNDIALLKAISSDFPVTEYTNTHIIIRNIPDCHCFDKLIRTFLVDGGLVESEDDITIYPSGMLVATRKECDCMGERRPPDIREKECKKWCDRMATASITWCGGQFRTKKCQIACAMAVDVIKDGCYWCCKNGEFYNNCVKPFADILAQMDPSKCDPMFD